MSDQATPAPFASIHRCEEAITRIHSTRQSGLGNDEAVGADCILVRDTVSTRLFAEARRLSRLVPVTTEEIFEAMIAKLYRDILYVSLQTRFGSYLESAATLYEDDDTTIDERASVGGEQDVGAVRVYNTRERREYGTNLFALELLIPADTLWEAVQQLGWSETSLATRFGVSLDAIRTQLVNVCCVEPVGLSREATTSATVLAEPDDDQRLAVTAPMPTLVVAGPGTGKTRSIVAKYLSLVDQGVDPTRILALTFSNKAAEEMRERIVAALAHTRPALQAGVEVSTFHAWGLNLLKVYGSYIDLPPEIQLRTRRRSQISVPIYSGRRVPGYQLRLWSACPPARRRPRPGVGGWRPLAEHLPLPWRLSGEHPGVPRCLHVRPPYLLRCNYRSLQSILDASHAIMHPDTFAAERLPLHAQRCRP